MLQLLTAKPVLYVCNVEEGSAADGNAHSAKVAQMAAEQGAGHVIISAAIEEEISQLDDDERAEFLEEMGLTLKLVSTGSFAPATRFSA